MSTLYSTALDKIIALYEGYSTEHRATTQPFHLAKVKKLLPHYQYAYDDLLIREPLIEHIGSLPIIATALYPYIQNPNVDLGKALIMLAIHDIGELETGDENTFTKKASDVTQERAMALELLAPEFHDLYLEVENRTSDTARFAKAIDKITPDIVDLLCPAEITIERYQKLTGKLPYEIVSMIKEFKHPYMVWNDFMKQLHLELLQRLESKLQPYY